MGGLVGALAIYNKLLVALKEARFNKSTLTREDYYRCRQWRS